MKKLIILPSIILIISISLIIYLNININLNKKKNLKFLETYNYIFNKQNIIYDKISFPKIEFNNTDYVGVINVLDKLIPIESICNSSFISTKSACLLYKKPFIILGTNLKDSFNFYNKIDINAIVSFTNNIGNTFEYKIKNIKRLNNLNNINTYNEDLIIIIKNYYSLEYILFICEKS